MRKKRELTEGDFNLMGLPKEYWGASWSFLSDGEVKTKIYNYLISLNQDHRIIHDGDGLYLFGGNGSSKTYISAICAKAFRKYEYKVMFTSAVKFQKDCEDGVEFEEGITVLDRARDVDVLVIDDFGKEVPSFKGTNYVLEMIDFRRDWKKILIINSRMNPADADDKYAGKSGQLDQKIGSFMFVLKCDGNFYEKQEEKLQAKY